MNSYTVTHTHAHTHAHAHTRTHTQPFYGPFFQDHPGEPVPEENFWTLWCKERLTEADTPTIWLGATPSGLTSAHLHHPAISFTGHPTNSVKALKATGYSYTVSSLF